MRMLDDKLKTRLVFLMFAVLLVVSGCSEEDETPFYPGPGDNFPDSSLPFPDTPEQLMANFQVIYETMDVDEYKLILDPGFETHLQKGTQDTFPEVGSTFNVTQENRIHERMFQGQSLQDPDGNFLPGIAGISFSKFRVLVDWGDSLPTDPIPNTLSALYEVDVLIDRGQQFSTLKVDGSIRFYVATAEGMLNGESKTYYRMIGQKDLTLDLKGVENIAWGTLKASFR